MPKYAGRTCQHQTWKQITCSFKVMQTMESPNLGACHEQSHDNHISIRTVTTEFAKLAVKEVIFSLLYPIGRYRIANCLENEH